VEPHKLAFVHGTICETISKIFRDSLEAKGTDRRGWDSNPRYGSSSKVLMLARALLFADFALRMLVRNPRYCPVSCGWFAIWFAILVALLTTFSLSHKPCPAEAPAQPLLQSVSGSSTFSFCFSGEAGLRVTNKYKFRCRLIGVSRLIDGLNQTTLPMPTTSATDPNQT
jgi:hypothetical protein